MKEDLNCDIVKDLLPNYIEKLTSETTNQSIENHLANCENCSDVYSKMQGDLTVDSVPELKNLSRFLNKTKFMYGMMSLLALGGIGILTSLIVDLAINRGLTWSLIVTAGIIYGYSLGYFLIMGEKRRFLKALIFISIFTFPLLGIIQAVTIRLATSYYHVWFWDMGIPITFIWLVIIWLVVLIRRVTKWNTSLCIAILLAFSLFGNYYTNIIVGANDNFADYMNNFVANGLGTVIAAVVFLVIGLIFESKKKS